MNVHGNKHHSILATFDDSQKAEDALAALLSAGITDATLDKINPIVLGKTPEPRDDNLEETIDSAARVLMASDPSHVEYDLEKQGVEEKKGYLLKIATGTSKLNQALKIVKKYGGEI